jgi:hypothetical protein
MASGPPSSRRVPSSDFKGQRRVIFEVGQLVDRWRGFPLGSAAAPYPEEPAAYEPTTDGERPLTEPSLALLHHWFRHEPHPTAEGVNFRYWPHQRRLVETFIYLHEVRGVRRTEQLYKLAGVDPLTPQSDPWPKLGGHLATGSGKTKMMSLLVAWAYLNALHDPSSSLGFGRHIILIAPGLFVRDRLLHDFAPPSGRPSVFEADPVVPPEFRSVWDLKVYGPDACPRSLDPNEGALVVTNFHQLLRTSDPVAQESELPRERRQLDLLFQGKDPTRLELVDAPLIERFARSKGLLVINDEAHHVWDETGHAKVEQRAKEKAELEGDPEAETAMAWIRSIRHLNGDNGRVALQVDLSATLFEEQGSKQKGAKTEFRQVDLFRHTAVAYGLAEAIADGIVKKPVLERVVAKNKKTGVSEPLIRPGQPNAWERYKHLLVTGIERWKKVRDQLADEGDPRKPILFILCSDKKEAREVANYLSYGEAVNEDRSDLAPTGYLDPLAKKRLFLEPGPDGAPRSTVIEIHIGEKQDSNDAEWERVRQSVNAIDFDEIEDPEGARDEHGNVVMLRNPYNVVVSVMMLKEGWDVRNVKVIVPLRPCDSRTLTEQALGRGLRKMHAPIIDDEGAAELRREERRSSELRNYQALKKNVIQGLQRSSFTSAALDSGDELRVARLLDRAPDVLGWVYNHRSGVGYFIEYPWKGRTSRYYPDFAVRARLGEVVHNFIVEVKGRIDDRDKAKARRGREYCEMLTNLDSEPWHYLFLIESPSDARSDITWWEQRSSPEIAHLLQHHEGLPLIPMGASQPPKAAPFEVIDSVPEVDQYESALPVYDLAVAAGAFGASQSPESLGWARVQTSRALDRKMFVARVVGRSMEDAVPSGSWCIFRQYAAGSAPSATSLDGRRVIVQLQDEADPDTGGRYTFKRWFVTKRAKDGSVEEIELRPDNPALKPKRYTASDGDVRVVAEFVEVVG